MAGKAILNITPTEPFYAEIAGETRALVRIIVALGRRQPGHRRYNPVSIVLGFETKRIEEPNGGNGKSTSTVRLSVPDAQALIDAMTKILP